MLINNNFFFVSANILCMLAGYSIELNNRKLFFSGFKLKQAKERVSQINLELDQRVKERTHELSAVNTNLSREIDTIEQVMVTPIRKIEFILGKTLS